MTTFSKSIDILADGKLRILLTTNKRQYIQPPIIVDTLDENNILIVRGSSGQSARVSPDIKNIDGIPFSGDFAAVSESIRILALKSNSLNAGIYTKKASKFTLDTNFVPRVLTVTGTEYLIYLFRVKAGENQIDIKQVIASILSTSNDNFLIRAGYGKTFDHTFVDGNFVDIGNGSALQVATPGLLGVPALSIATGFFTGGKNTKVKYGTNGDEVESVNGIPFRMVEGVTFAMCALGGSLNANLDIALNWQEVKC